MPPSLTQALSFSAAASENALEAELVAIKTEKHELEREVKRLKTEAAELKTKLEEAGLEPEEGTGDE